MNSNSGSRSSAECNYPTTFQESTSSLVDVVPQSRENHNCSGRGTKLHKTSWVFIFVLLLNCFLFAATVAYLFRAQQQQEKEQDNCSKALTEDFATRPKQPEGICSTTECWKAANNIINHMDPTESPCDDFYQYACGNLIHDDNITGNSLRGPPYVIFEELNQIIKDLLEWEIDDDLDSELLIKMKNFYPSCLNEAKGFTRNLHPLTDIVKRLGGWPTVDGDRWNATGFSWTDFMVQCNDIHVPSDAFLDVIVSEDVFNTSRHILRLSEGKSLLHMLYENILMYGPLNSILRFFGAYNSKMLDDGLKVVDLGTEMRQLLENEENTWNMSRLYTLTNLSHLQVSAPEVNWKDLLERLVHVKLADDEPILLKNENYILNFNKILNKTNPRTLANFAMGYMVLSLMPSMKIDLYDLYDSDSRISDTCVQLTNNKFSAGISQEYIDIFFEPEWKVKVNEMVNLIKQEMQDILNRSNWLDRKTLALAQQKLLLMHAVVGYPDELLDYEKVAELYENVNISKATYFENMKNFTQVTREQNIAKLRKPVKKHDWQQYTRMANIDAYYDNVKNSIIIPAGILQGVFFNYVRPQYMNFGAIGSAIGHEIMHAFELKGLQFDGTGSINDWWKPETDKKFQERAQCMIHQYTRYKNIRLGKHLNGKKTILENIADNGGVKIAYYAYQKWVEKHGREEVLPKLNLTANQIFWMSYANTWCEKLSTYDLENQIETDTHSLSRFRVNGPLSNFPEFAKDFNCPVNSAMNPVKRCGFW